MSKPRVVFHDVDGVRHEPIELVTADIEEAHQGGVLLALGERKGTETGQWHAYRPYRMEAKSAVPEHRLPA